MKQRQPSIRVQVVDDFGDYVLAGGLKTVGEVQTVVRLCQGVLQPVSLPSFLRISEAQQEFERQPQIPVRIEKVIGNLRQPEVPDTRDT